MFSYFITKVKNSSIIEHRSIGGLVGYISSGTLTMNGTITMENVSVQTVGGRSALIVGFYDSTPTFTFGSTLAINLSNCSYTIYECNKNTGTGYGLNDAGTEITSWHINGTNNKGEDTYGYAEGAYVMISGAERQPKHVAGTDFNDYVKVIK